MYAIRSYYAETLVKEQYAFVCFMSNENLSIRESKQLYSGAMSVFPGVNKAVSNKGKQTPPDNLGVDTFEFWIPKRRPQGQNIAMEISPSINAYAAMNIYNGYVRPWGTANSWTADLKDKNPSLTIEWNKEQTLSEIILFFDGDYDHAMESVQFGHHDSVVPQCVRNYKVKTSSGDLLFDIKNNYQTINTLKLDKSIQVKGLVVEVEHPSEHVPATIFEIVIK